MTRTRPAPDLGEDDLTPLVQATASRTLDTCLRGARGLAVLGDPRALGLLLQLSREQDPSARVEVCRALAALEDPRAADRLRSLLYDDAVAVRDAAFTALSKLLPDQPLPCAGAGLNAAHEDVRRRGLEALVRFLRQSPQHANQAGPALEMLARALNDGASAVRNEAFKATLNLQAAGGGVQTLRFILQSVHPDVRLEVLTEVMAQVREPWAWNLLLEFYNDPEAMLRRDAFNTAVAKNKELPPLESALLSQYADVRKWGVESLIKKHTAPAQALLIKALADADKDVRQLALGALIGEGARASLLAALASPHPDVRVRAARALARHGETQALAPLLALATAAEPPEGSPQRSEWQGLVEYALEALAELGDPAALAPLVPLLQSKLPSVRKLSARALAWAALPHHRETLRQALQHADPQVKYAAALGMAYAGDPLVASLVFSEPAAALLSRDEQLVAALTLGLAGEDRLALFLDDADEALRWRTLVIEMLLELKSPSGAPARCLTCLSARSPRVRLAAARALERFAGPVVFRDYVVQLMNDRGDEPPWKLTADTVDALAELLARGGPAARARTGHLLRHLSEKEPAAWEQFWPLHAARFGAEIRALREGARDRKTPAPQYTPEQLQELAFGAYVGLVREQGGSAAAYGTEAQVVRVRQTALSRLQEMATTGGRAAAARPVMIQALSDPYQAVRLQAFDQLAALGLDADTLGAAALGAGHTDVGIRGLEKMAGGGTSAEGRAVLEETLRTRTDDLATEAAKLLAGRRGMVSVAGLALGAAYEPLRTRAVDWLAAEYDNSPQARDLLRQALQSRYDKVVSAASFALGVKKDGTAFDALVTLLRLAKEEAAQLRVIEALSALGDPRAAGAFLDRVDTDPEGSALVDPLFACAARFRQPETADRLLAMAGNEKWRAAALAGALTVSGFEQVIEDPEDENSDRNWEKQQHPRSDAIFARALKRAIDLKANATLTAWMPEARWARGSEVDAPLAVLTVYADDGIRRAAVEAVGWRLRKRGGPAEPLLKALKHRDPETQFTAACGLGRAGRTEALAPLMAAVDLQDDPELRKYAVEALGELGHPRALDLLLKIVNDPGHALRQAAVEAVGRMGRSANADEVLELLEGLARGADAVSLFALRGLRWLDHPEGWQLIRRRAADWRSWIHQSTALELLAYNDDPATRDLLLRLLAEDVSLAVFPVLESARRLWGQDSLEPDYAAVRNQALGEENLDDLLRRLQERGDARRMLEILPKLSSETALRLKGILLGRQPLPVAEAQTVVAGPDATAAGVAAHLLGRAGATESGPAVAAALGRWWGEWDKGRQEETRRGAQPGKAVGPLLEPLRRLCWAAGRLGVAADSLIAVARTRADVPFDRPLRREAAAALAGGKPGTPVLAALEELAADGDPELRATAAQAVARADPTRAPATAGRVLSDRVTFNRVARLENARLAQALPGAAGQVHYQGIAVPHLAARRDVAGLAAVANDRSLTDEARLGAIEGLAASGTKEAEVELAQFGSSPEKPEELRKAAWRGLRRSKRARQRAAT
jgi:ParB family chromosome partitioning protein